MGYGDLTAQTHLGRLLANAEAVVGQVYLVTFVAMIVGLRAQEWRNRGGRPAPPDGAGAGRVARDIRKARHGDGDGPFDRVAPTGFEPALPP